MNFTQLDKKLISSATAVVILIGGALVCYQNCSVGGGTVNSAGGSSTAQAMQTPPFISSVWDSGHDANNAGFDDIGIAGSFTGSGDEVWTSCDGSSSFTQAPLTSDTIASLSAMIATPANFESCQIYVIEGGTQTPTYVVLQITGAVDSGASASNTSISDVTLTGSFVGKNRGGDQVWVSCDGASQYSQIAASNIQSDTASSISILLSNPNNFATCEFYVIANGFQSATYSQ